MSTSGCSVADLVSSALAMVLRRKLGEASPPAPNHTKQLEQRAIIQGRRSWRADGKGEVQVGVRSTTEVRDSPLCSSIAFQTLVVDVHRWGPGWVDGHEGAKAS